jgi:hypothetical protein
LNQISISRICPSSSLHPKGAVQLLGGKWQEWLR